MDFGSRYPDVYYSGDGRSYIVGEDRYHDHTPRSKGHEFQNYGYDRRKIPKPAPVNHKIPPPSDGYGPRPKYFPRSSPDEYSYPSLPRDEYKPPRQNGVHHQHPRDPRHYRDRSRSSDGDYNHDSRERDYFRPPYGDPVRSQWDDRNPRQPSDYGSWPGDHGQFDSLPYSKPRDKRGLINGRPLTKDGRKQDYPPPTRFLFVMIGVLLILIGIIKVLFAIWNHFYATIWSGFLVAILGILGMMHGRNYHSKGKNIAYIVFGVLVTLAVLVASALHIGTIVAIIRSMALQQGVNFLVSDNATSLLKLSRTDHAVMTYDLQTQIYVSLGLDMAALILLCASNYVLTAVASVMSHYSDARWGVYTECHPGPKKKPVFFNPFDQISMGQFCIFVGLVAEFVIDTSYSATFVIGTAQTTYWSPVWVGFIVIIAGFTSAIGEKWSHVLSRGIAALALEFIAFLACIAGIAVCTMGLYNNVIVFTSIPSTDAAGRGPWIANISAYCVAIAALVANFLFICGIVIRYMWQLCCKKTSR